MGEAGGQRRFMEGVYGLVETIDLAIAEIETI